MNTPLVCAMYWVGCFTTGMVLGMIVEELIIFIKRKR